MSTYDDNFYLRGKKLVNAILNDPQIITDCSPEHISSSGWIDILLAHPELIEFCPLENLSCGVLIDIFCEYPEFARRCNFQLFSKSKLASLKKQLIDAEFTGDVWCNIIIHNRFLANYCPWSTLTDREWDFLLEHCPEFAEKRKKKSSISDEDISTPGADILTELIRKYREQKNTNPEKEHFKNMLTKAEQGDPDAQCEVGLCYDQGKGVGKNYALAAEWYARSAAQDCTRGQRNLALMYYCGEGVEKNYEKACPLFRKAADKGDTVAQYMLGTLYCAKAKIWLAKAADQKHEKASGLLQALKGAIAGDAWEGVE